MYEYIFYYVRISKSKLQRWPLLTIHTLSVKIPSLAFSAYK